MAGGPAVLHVGILAATSRDAALLGLAPFPMNRQGKRTNTERAPDSRWQENATHAARCQASRSNLCVTAAKLLTKGPVRSRLVTVTEAACLERQCSAGKAACEAYRPRTGASEAADQQTRREA